jgi:hypothetical protein
MFSSVFQKKCKFAFWRWGESKGVGSGVRGLGSRVWGMGRRSRGRALFLAFMDRVCAGGP